MNINNIENINKKPYNASIEALRGWVSIIVWISHIVLFPNIMQPEAKWGFYFPAGHYSVLIFFMLSGYVIGVNYPKTSPKSNFGIWIQKYLWRRFIRLYPLYFVALIMSYLLIEELKPSASFLLHLCFGQEAFTPTLMINAPLWSLHYEVLYYLLFIVLYFFSEKLPLTSIILSLVVIAFLRTVFRGGHGLQISFGYATGYAFWLTGLWMAWHLPQKQEPIQYGKIVAACFMAFVAPVWNVLLLGQHFLVEQQLLLPAAGAAIAYSDILYLPSVCLIVLIPANVQYRYFSHLLLFVCFLSTTHILYSLFYGQCIFAKETHLLGLICFLLVIIFWHLPNTKYLSFFYKKLIPIGTISYGIYIFHFPLMQFIGWFFTWQIPYKYVACIFLLAILTFIFAYFFEKKVQPRIKKWSNHIF